MIPTTAVAVIQKNKYRILSPPLAGTSCEGHFICPFCREGSSCPHCNFLPDGRSRHNPASQSSKSKSLSDGRREGDALGCPSFWQLYSSSGGLFPAFRTFFPYFLPLLSFLTRGRGRKHKQGKKQNKKLSPCGLVFVFREIIEFKFKRVYLRSFFIETSEPDAI